jgi:hypothetical protein
LAWRNLSAWWRGTAGDYCATIAKYPVGNTGVLAEVFLLFFLAISDKLFHRLPLVEAAAEFRKKNVRGIL